VGHNSIAARSVVGNTTTYDDTKTRTQHFLPELSEPSVNSELRRTYWARTSMCFGPCLRIVGQI